MSSFPPTLTLYRARIPAHAAVADATVEAYLADAIEAHTAAPWGQRYDVAMCYWAAHRIQRTPGMGVATGTAEEAGALTLIGSADVQRSFAVPRGATAEDADLRTTRYGQLYLEERGKLAASAPFVVGP